jgi:hypothetical protein
MSLPTIIKLHRVYEITNNVLYRDLLFNSHLSNVEEILGLKKGMSMGPIILNPETAYARLT